jgi:hypothetical protein
VQGGSATQKEGRTTKWRMTWRRSSGAYLSLQSASGAVEKEKKGGSSNGAGDSRFGENRGRARMERKEGKRWGRRGVPPMAVLVVERVRPCGPCQFRR